MLWNSLTQPPELREFYDNMGWTSLLLYSTQCYRQFSVIMESLQCIRWMSLACIFPVSVSNYTMRCTIAPVTCAAPDNGKLYW